MNTKLKKIICGLFDWNNRGFVDLEDIGNVTKYTIVAIIALVGYMYGMYIVIFQTNSMFNDTLGFFQFLGILTVIICTVFGIVAVSIIVIEKISKRWNEIKYKKVVVCECKKGEE